jgi:hypothetical protein
MTPRHKAITGAENFVRNGVYESKWSLWKCESPEVQQAEDIMTELPLAYDACDSKPKTDTISDFAPEVEVGTKRKSSAKHPRRKSKKASLTQKSKVSLPSAFEVQARKVLEEKKTVVRKLN